MFHSDDDDARESCAKYVCLLKLYGFEGDKYLKNISVRIDNIYIYSYEV